MRTIAIFGLPPILKPAAWKRESPRTTKLYDRTGDEIALDENELRSDGPTGRAWMSWNVIIQDIRRPGRLRQAAMVGLLAIMIATCLALVLKSAQGEVLVALEIFLVSVSGFSLIAWISFDASLGWRFVDFPWICTSFAAIIVALLNISEADRLKEVSLAKSAD
jgi:hypothetical protein